MYKGDSYPVEQLEPRVVIVISDIPAYDEMKVSYKRLGHPGKEYVCRFGTTLLPSHSTGPRKDRGRKER